MPLDSEIVIVSGLPRSGTSLMMQMLDRGGIPALTDQVRTADADNPRGYYEFERVKQLQQDRSWLPQARGRVVKMVSPLLYQLPSAESFRIIFMQRELEEVLASQEKMLQRRNRPAIPRDQMRASYKLHLERLFEWLPRQSYLRVLPVSYNELLADSLPQVQRIADFLDRQADPSRMLEAVDPGLHRNKAPSEPS